MQQDDRMAEDATPAKASILVVDDERLIALGLRSTLQRMGYRVAGIAETGEAALAMAGELRPDLALMDIKLKGDMDGIEAAEQIGRLHNIPVVYLSAFWDDKTLARAKASGPFGFLIKPYDERDLRMTIEVALYKSKLERELRMATLAAEAANEAKTSFLATISHELRTPLNGILGMGELLGMTGLSGEQRELLDLIRDSAQSLMNIINQILDYSQIEARILELREGEFDVRSLLAALMAKHGTPARRKNLHMSWTVDDAVPEFVRGDSGRLRQILDHLVRNAVSFTAQGSVDVKVSLCGQGDECSDAQRPASRLMFTVADTGEGIPQEKLEQVFESFTQMENYMTRRHGGLGLGLATCRKLARLMGGSLWAESMPGMGSTFYLVVEFERLGDPAQPGALRNGALTGVRVLVAEDNLVNRKFVARSLEKRGCVVKTVEDGRQALLSLSQDPFDVVLMDVQMPVMDGIEATRSIRTDLSRRFDRTVPIVALTAHAVEGDEQWCLDAGMDAYVTKPVEVETLVAVLVNTLDKRRASGYIPPDKTRP